MYKKTNLWGYWQAMDRKSFFTLCFLAEVQIAHKEKILTSGKNTILKLRIIWTTPNRRETTEHHIASQHQCL
jgi:hypothetical protein